MSDDIKPAILSEGDAKVRRDNESQEGVSTQTQSPDIEADAEQDPQAPNRKGLG